MGFLPPPPRCHAYYCTDEPLTSYALNKRKTTHEMCVAFLGGANNASFKPVLEEFKTWRFALTDTYLINYNI